MARRSLVIAALAAFAALSPGGAVGSSPHAFKDDLDARLAADGSELWIGVLGEGSQGLVARTYLRVGDEWSPLPPVPWSVSAGNGLSFTQAPPGLSADGPCLGLVSSGTPVVACLQGGSWERLPFEKPDRRFGDLVDMRVVDNRLTALLARGNTRARVRAYGKDGWERRGPALELDGGIAALGQAGGGTQLDVGVNRFSPPQRSVWTLDGEEWLEGPILVGPGEGPQVGGPVRLGDRLLLPVIDASGGNWPFTVYVSENGGGWTPAGGGPLNVGKGFAQGQVDLAAGQAWASWQQNALTSGRFYRTRIFAARYQPAPGEFETPELLWRGRSIGPGQTQVIATDDEVFALIMRAPNGRPGGGLVAAVKTIESL